MALHDDFLQELRLRADVETVVAPYVNLRRRGRTLVGLCPFHNEKTPSFTVYPETQSFYCFGCGAGGDVITFIRRIENLDYIESVKLLADRTGLAMPQDGYDDTLGRRRKRMLEANRAAARFFHETLLGENGRVCLDYLLGRGVSPHMIRHFGLGFVPDQWDSLLTHMQSIGFSSQELYEANLVRRSEKNGRVHYYDNFRNRMMIPIIDLRGNVVAFGGRVMDDSKPKYINTSDTLVYNKGEGVFALNFAKNGNEGKLILAEGYMDVIALHQAGFTNAIACLGTALTKEQTRLISRYAQEVVLSYDADEAGQKATRKAMALFDQTGVKLRVLRLEGGKDPDEIIKTHGKERFRDLLDGAANDTEYQLLRERDKYDLKTSDGKVAFLRAASLILAQTDNQIERDVYAGRLAEELSVEKSAILTEAERNVKKAIRQREKQRFRGITSLGAGQTDRVNPERGRNLRAAKAEELLIASLMNNPDFLHGLDGKVSPEDFATAFNRRVFVAVRARIRENRPLELSFFAADFSPEEMGRIAELQALGPRLSNTPTECEDCIRVLREESQKRARVDPAEASDEEFLQLLAQERARRKEQESG